MSGLTCLEICAGAGGQSLGLEEAGFEHVAAIEIDPDACETLRLNGEDWNVLEMDVRRVDGSEYRGVDLLAGGVPCPPFSIAGKQLGAEDERDLFPEALRLVEQSEPQAVMLENVRGLASGRFAEYRDRVVSRLELLGYKTDWQVLNASEYGVPQLRPRFILVALRPKAYEHFVWPTPQKSPPTVGSSLRALMGVDGWELADAWAERAKGIAPTLVGGSRKHGGPDLGPTRAREEWKKLGIDGRGIADQPPQPGASLDTPMPRLTLQMAAKIQGFPAEYVFSGRKTAAYRQIGNAFPPPVALAVGNQIADALEKARSLPIARLAAVS